MFSSLLYDIFSCSDLQSYRNPAQVVAVINYNRIVGICCPEIPSVAALVVVMGTAAKHSHDYTAANCLAWLCL